MTTAYRTFGSPYALGLTSLVLSAVGLLLFFLPILGIPLASVGLLFGLAGLLAALFGARSSLRWSVLGVLLSFLALGTDLSDRARSAKPHTPSGGAADLAKAVRPCLRPPARRPRHLEVGIWNCRKKSPGSNPDPQSLPRIHRGVPRANLFRNERAPAHDRSDRSGGGHC